MEDGGKLVCRRFCRDLLRPEARGRSGSASGARLFLLAAGANGKELLTDGRIFFIGGARAGAGGQ